MRKYALIGKSLNHSFSANFFNEKFKREEIIAKYDLLEFNSIEAVAEFLKTTDISGFNVTIPFKESIIPFLSSLSQEARNVGAVNTLVKENGNWVGYNTDTFGFKQSIKPFLTNLHERALILGTGGSSKAVTSVFNSLGINCVFVSRTPNSENQFLYSDVNSYMLNACKVIVNCTPVGMFPNVNEQIAFPFEFLTNEHLVIDLIYNPSKTNFLTSSENNGATILNGESMLKAQALKSWELWNFAL